MDWLKLCKHPTFGYRIREYVKKREGGEHYSQTLREYMRTVHKVDIGLYSYGGCFRTIFNSNRWDTITIGRYCSFASDAICFRADHPIGRASCHPFFYESWWRKKPVKGLDTAPLVIGNDVWVGYGVIITKSCCSIGNGAVIGAGTVVTHDVPPYAIVCGSPAHVLRYRFNPDEIEALEASKWWELEPDELLEYYQYIEEPLVWAGKIAEMRAERKNNDKDK